MIWIGSFRYWVFPPRNNFFVNRTIFQATLVAALLVLGVSCKKAPSTTGADPAPGESPTAAVSENTATNAPTASSNDAGPAKQRPPVASPRPKLPPPPAEIWKLFSGEKALELARQQVEFGPRPAGSAEVLKARDHIVATLRAVGWQTEIQEFTDKTPRGPIKFYNVIARHSGEGSMPSLATQKAILCSHYDTVRFSTIRFVGANDGASSTGALLEIARVLAMDPALAAQVELVFFDGEEAVVQFTETDGLYGSRYYAKSLHQANRIRQFKFGVLLDMIGDANLNLTLDPNSPRDLVQRLMKSGDALGLRSIIGYHHSPILDDHVSLIRYGIPAIDLIDFSYPQWHTADDTMERISAESLGKIGMLTLHMLRVGIVP